MEKRTLSSDDTETFEQFRRNGAVGRWMESKAATAFGSGRVGHADIVIALICREM